MYRDTVTIFNHHAGTWYAHTLNGVDLNADRGAILAKYGAQSTDRAKLHIKYRESPGRRYAGDFEAVDPNEYTGEDGTITFRALENGEYADFFIEGPWDGGNVKDSDYTDGFFDYMNGIYSACYVITSVARYSVIPHYEILAR